MPPRKHQPAITRNGNSRPSRTADEACERMLSPSVQTGSSGQPRKKERPILSPRQEAVAKMVSRGLSDCEIAGELGVSENTVGDCLKVIFRRYGLHSRIVLAIRMLTETHARSHERGY